MSLSLSRLKDSRPVWVRLTALTARDASEQKGNGGRRTRAPCVNAEYVNTHFSHSDQSLVSMFLIKGRHSVRIRAQSAPSNCSTFSLFFALFPALHLHQHLTVLPSSWHHYLSRHVFMCSAPFSALSSFILSTLSVLLTEEMAALCQPLKNPLSLSVCLSHLSFVASLPTSKFILLPTSDNTPVTFCFLFPFCSPSMPRCNWWIFALIKFGRPKDSLALLSASLLL